MEQRRAQKFTFPITHIVLLSLIATTLSGAAQNKGAPVVKRVAAEPATCSPYIHWISQGVGPNETVMVCGWCFGSNATLLIDGSINVHVTPGIAPPGHNAGASMALISNPIPVSWGRHTVEVVTQTGVKSNPVTLNDAELWWIQGDEGAVATSGGWIRAFGRELIPRTTSDAHQETLPPVKLIRAWENLMETSAWTAAEQLNRLRAIVANHADWFAELPPQPTTVLVLEPVDRGRTTATAAAVTLTATAASTYSAEFTVPANLTPGEYTVQLQSGPGGAMTSLDFFESPIRPRVHTIRIKPAAPPTPPIVDVVGPFGVNITRDPTTPYGTTGDARPIDASPHVIAALKKAAAVAATSPGRVAVVKFGPGLFHVNGPIVIPNGVTLAGAGSDLTAVYFSYDNITTAPEVLIGPSAASNSWGVADMTLYVLGFYKTVFHIPSDTTATARFRMSRVTIRADAFHCQNGMAGLGKGRSPPWFEPCNASCGTLGGYQNAVFHLGRLTNTTSTQAPVTADVSTGPPNTPAVNIVVEDCDISGSWHIFQGAVQHFVARNNRIWNGGMAFYLIARESIIEGNDAVGSSAISGGGGYNFAQHLYHGNNRIRNIRGNDREVMTFDGEDGVYHGTVASVNTTHLVTPDCPGRPDSRFAGPVVDVNPVVGSQIVIVDGIGTGQLRRVVNASMPPEGACWFLLDKPFQGLDGVDPQNITIAILAFTGENIFERDTFEDCGPFQFYNSGMHDISAGNTFRRAEGAWNSGMDVAMSLRNGSVGKLSPNTAYFNEFVDNSFAVAHRAPHIGSPSKQNRDLFWNQPVAKEGMFTMGMAGQGTGHSNRFLVFRRNTIVGASGINVWGIGTSDVLVEGNVLNSTKIPIALDHFPGTDSAVTNVVFRANVEV